MGFSYLPADVYDRLLTTISDFHTLQCAVLSCKSLQEAYKIRRASIRHAVARRVVGSALKHALLLARIKILLERQDHNETTGKTISEWLVNNDAFERRFGSGITPEEERLLVRLACVVNRLEVVFCVRYENWDATTSVLGFQEQTEFRQSMYQAWILRTLVASGLQCFIEDDTLLANVWATMDTKEMERIMHARQFMGDVLDVYTSRFGWQHRFGLHFDDPEKVVYVLYCSFAQLGALAGTHQNFIDDIDNHVYLTFTNALSARKGLKSADTIQEVCTRDKPSSPCERCNEVQYLFCVNNWDWWERNFDAPDWLSYLPGNLRLNVFVARLVASFVHNEAVVNYAQMIGEMFEGLNDLGEGAEWRMEGRYCKPCLDRFIGEHLYSWLIKKLVKDGHHFSANCWYGWNCRTQSHKYGHALKLNHLCEPGRRDDTWKTPTAAEGDIGDESDDEDGEHSD